MTIVASVNAHPIMLFYPPTLPSTTCDKFMYVTTPITLVVSVNAAAVLFPVNQTKCSAKPGYYHSIQDDQTAAVAQEAVVVVIITHKSRKEKVMYFLQFNVVTVPPLLPKPVCEVTWGKWMF